MNREELAEKIEFLTNGESEDITIGDLIGDRFYLND